MLLNGKEVYHIIVNGEDFSKHYASDSYLVGKKVKINTQVSEHNYLYMDRNNKITYQLSKDFSGSFDWPEHTYTVLAVYSDFAYIVGYTDDHYCYGWVKTSWINMI